MIMFEILVFIFIGIAIYKRVQRAKQEGGTGNNSMPNTTVTTSSAQNSTRPQAQSMPRSNPAQTVTQPRPTQSAPRRNPMPPVQHNPAQAAIQEAKEDGNTTTAYLMEKAQADAKEHAKEKYEEQKRLYETRGGLAVAERFLDGDTIPQGKRCVNCGYCGAENLVPMMPRTKYSCYFCREPL